MKAFKPFLSGLVMSLLCCGSLASAKILDLKALSENENLSKSERAEQLTQAAFREMFGRNLYYAHEIALAALQLDAQNQGAQFLAYMLHPLEHTRGLLNRLNLEKWKFSRRSRQRYENMKKDSAGYYGRLPGPTSPIQDTKSLNEFLEQLEPYLLHSIAGLKSLRTMAYEIEMEEPDEDGISSKCRVLRLNELKYDTKNCDSVQRTKTVVDRLDVEALLYIHIATLIYIRLYSAYEIPGTYQALKANAKQRLKPDKMLAFLKTFPGFGKLKANHRLSDLLVLGGDLINGLDFFQKNMGKLCNFEVRSSTRFSAGFMCFESVDSRLIPGLGVFQMVEALETNLRLGRPHSFNLNVNEPDTIGIGSQAERRARFAIRMDLTEWLKNPMADLRPILPTRTSGCGAFRGFADPTFGGIFPDGDADQYMVLRVAHRPFCDRDSYVDN